LQRCSEIGLAGYYERNSLNLKCGATKVHEHQVVIIGVLDMVGDAPEFIPMGVWLGLEIALSAGDNHKKK